MPEPREAPAEPRAGLDTSAAHVLVAEDSRLAAALMRAALEQDGHRVTHVADGNAALGEVLGGDRLDLLLTDGQMPGMDGVGLCRAIRRTDPSLPIIFVTSSADQVVEALDAGADDFIRKPFEPTELRARVRAALRTGQLRRQLATERDRSKALVASMQDGLAVFDPEGRIVDMNDRLSEITGYGREELVGMAPPFPFWPPERAEAYSRRLARGLQGGGGPEGDRVYVHKTGGTIEVIVSLSPLRDADGSGSGAYVSTVKDVSTRRAAERDLRQSNERHRALAEEQARLTRVAATVARSQEPDEVFALVAREVAELLGAEAGGVARFEGDSAVLVGAWTSVEELRMPPGARLPLQGESATARVRREGRPVRIEDYASLAESWHAGVPMARLSSVAAPVRVGGELWGAVGAICQRRGGLPPGAEGRLADFASLVGVAIASADARATLALQAATDALTGLANRRQFEARLDAEVARAKADGTSLSVVLFDLDHFKEVNDTFGHEVGDQVLCELARRMSTASRSSDLVARIGGEEFAIVLSGADRETAVVVAERVRAAVSGAPFGEAGERTISAGVATFREGDDGAGLLRRSDRRLYAAKRLGRNRVVSRDLDPVAAAANR